MAEVHEPTYKYALKHCIFPFHPISTNAITKGHDPLLMCILHYRRALRERCQRYFGDLVPGRKVDLVRVSRAASLEEGLRFVLLPEAAHADAHQTMEKKGAVDHQHDRTKSTAELSGGQRSLLGLSFVFAAALHKRSPLYLLDEVRNVTCDLH